MRLDFRNFFEFGNYEQDLETADYWSRVKPTDSSLVNEAEIKDFVAKMANEKANLNALQEILDKKSVNEHRYEKPISQNLVRTTSPRYKDAIGAVTSLFGEKYKFKFWGDGEWAGALRIIHPPLIYGPYEKVMLAGIVRHEVQHAIDYLDPNYEASFRKEAVFNEKLYENKLTEARGFAAELAYLMKALDYDTDIVLEVLYSAKFTHPDHILSIAEIYLTNNYGKRDEGWLSKAVAPVALWTALAGRDNATQTPGNAKAVQSPNVTLNVRQQQQQVKRAAQLAVKVVSAFLFSNFVT